MKSKFILFTFLTVLPIVLCGCNSDDIGVFLLLVLLACVPWKGNNNQGGGGSGYEKIGEYHSPYDIYKKK